MEGLGPLGATATGAATVTGFGPSEVKPSTAAGGDLGPADFQWGKGRGSGREGAATGADPGPPPASQGTVAGKGTGTGTGTGAGVTSTALNVSGELNGIERVGHVSCSK